MPEPIKVVIKDEVGEKSVSVGASGNSTGTSTGTQQAKDNKRSSEVSAAATFVAMRTVSYATSNVGKWTGSRQNQTIVNNTQKVAGYGMALATNVWLGIAVIATDAAFTIGNFMYERSIEEKRSNQAKLRLGDTGGYRR